MVMDLVLQLQLPINTSLEYQREFQLGNGNTIKALGVVITECSFAKEPAVQLQCLFYVFRTLIAPLIMGMSFLGETKTLSENRHRLQPRASIPRGLFELCSINNPRRRLACLAESQPALANADTGSEVDLISLAYVRKRNFCITPIAEQESMVQFADGSVSLLVGKVILSIILGNLFGRKLKVVFYVLQNLTCDLLLGEDFLNETNAFQTYEKDFSNTDDENKLVEINTIVWLNAAEKFLGRCFSRLGLAKSASHIAAGKKILHMLLLH